MYRLERSVARTLHPSRYFNPFSLPRDISTFGSYSSDRSPLEARIKKLEEYTKTATKGFAEFKEQLEETDSRMIRLTFISLVDPLGATRFFQIAPFVSQMLPGRDGVSNLVVQMRRNSENLSSGEVGRAISFAISSTLKIESKGLGTHINPNVVSVEDGCTPDAI